MHKALIAIPVVVIGGVLAAAWLGVLPGSGKAAPELKASNAAGATVTTGADLPAADGDDGAALGLQAVDESVGEPNIDGSPVDVSANIRNRESSTAGSPFEASLLTGGAVNQHATKLLEQQDFDQVLSELDAQNAGRQNRLAGDYRQVLETTLQAVTKAKLDRFACGVNVCMGSVRSRNDGSFGDWLGSIQAASRLPMGALTEFAIKHPGGIVEHRILFTTNPSSAGFYVPPEPPGNH